MKPTATSLNRCQWSAPHEEMVAYHDKEWGVPLFDDDKLFEFLVLEGMQAGLSWLTALRKRENFRKAFDRFNAKKIAQYKAPKIKELLSNEGIIRNRLKIAATVSNAAAFLKIQKEEGSFQAFIWDFVGGKPIQNRWKRMNQIPATSRESDRMSKVLKEKGFRFVGSTICYAHMQATGMVNDHTADCFRYKQVQKSV